MADYEESPESKGSLFECSFQLLFGLNFANFILWMALHGLFFGGYGLCVNGGLKVLKSPVEYSPVRRLCDFCQPPYLRPVRDWPVSPANRPYAVL